MLHHTATPIKLCILTDSLINQSKIIVVKKVQVVLMAMLNLIITRGK